MYTHTQTHTDDEHTNEGARDMETSERMELRGEGEKEVEGE